MQKAFYVAHVLLLTLTQVGAQSFGLPGTAWEHCWTLSVIESPPSTDFVKSRSGRTFERDGMQCNTLYFSTGGLALVGDSISICRSGDQVLYLEGDSSYLLYDFALQAGDTLSVRYPHGFDPRFSTDRPDDDVFMIAIDSVTTDSIMGVALRKQHIDVLSENPFVSFGSFILERVGFEYWVLPYFGYEALDGDGFLGLRSYKDDQVIFEDESVCDTRVSIISEDHELQLEIYPNPAHEYLVVDAKTLIRGITISDVAGRKLSSESPQFGPVWSVPLDMYGPGIYFAEVRFGDRVEVRKFVVRK